MSKAIQVPYKYNVDVPIETAQAVQANRENPISLEALGLLVNLLSYPSTWELHKTELYKRFGKNKEKSVRSAWNDLEENNYITEFKYRIGKKYEYIYYYRKMPFTEEEKAEILEKAEKEFGEIWGLRFGDSNLETSKGRGNQKTILNQNNILNNSNKMITEVDDDKRTSSTPQANKAIESTPHNEDEINLIISNERERTKNDLTDRSFNSVVRRVMTKYNSNKFNPDSFIEYLSVSLDNKIEELAERRKQDQLRKDAEEAAKAKQPIKVQTPKLYNWLDKKAK